MKQTENNEIDLLLRDLGRRRGANSALGGDHSAEHLDADELNSYAEQALPAATRARYTSHLADCTSCRKIVADLTSSSGVTVGEQSVSQKTSSGLLQKLGALFSPGSLRYAIPALALIAFAAIGWVVLRQQRAPDFVAMRQREISPADALQTEQPGAVAEPEESATSNAAASNKERLSDSQTTADKTKDNLAKSGESDQASPTPTQTNSVSVAAERNASLGKASGVVAQPAYAPEPPPPAAPKPQISPAESRTETTARQKKEASKNEDGPVREQEGTRARSDDSRNQVAQPQTARRAPAVQGEEKLRSADEVGASAAGARAKDDEAETRTVSGRRFRRQGGVWIDIAFRSSAATTVVSRGSDQFRALVADEPELRNIAARLSGEVVVVWKGRAYRIR